MTQRDVNKSRDQLQRLYNRIKETSQESHDPEKEHAQMLQIVDFIECCGSYNRDRISEVMLLPADTVSSRLNEAINVLGLLVYLKKKAKTKRGGKAHFVEAVPGMREAWKDRQYEDFRMRLFRQADMIDIAFKQLRRMQNRYLKILKEWHEAVGYSNQEAVYKQFPVKDEEDHDS